MSDNSEQNTSNKGLKAFVAILIIISVAVAMFFIIKTVVNKNSSDPYSNNGSNISNNDGAGKLLSRSANNGDINLDVDGDFSLSINMTVTPNTEISNLQITFSFLDNNRNTLTTKTKILGNVSRNHPYNVSFSLSEFSFSQMLKITAVSATVSGGTVSYFA